ncbi:MAG: phospholipase D-like domain-containing protein [Woeseiaceae bacterium]
MLRSKPAFAILILSLLLHTAARAQTISETIHDHCDHCADLMTYFTGAYILEKGEEALLGRAWLVQHAEKTIDIQYFIWSTDNIGTLAAEQLLLAAERGVKVRVLVDDLLIDAEGRTLLLLSAHPNVQIRIYNPNLSVGVSFWRRIVNGVTRFRDVNQRMHDKTAIFDGIAGITGGRNMADEYFDYDHDYNFRDRDILLLGRAVTDMRRNFDEFWVSEFAVPVESIFADSEHDISAEDGALRAQRLHAYANNPANFSPHVRQSIANAADSFQELMQAMTWQHVAFISDVPGKNDGESGLGGGGESTNRLITAVKEAKHSILLQSPYLILPDGGIELFESLIRRGVRIRISTNSLASTDNIPAFAGYHGQRSDLLEVGVELFEFKPYPKDRRTLIERYPSLAAHHPIFSLHAKSMVIDDKTIFIGTFNLDPRSANLNTEVGVLVNSYELARQLTESIERDIAPGNSWQSTTEFTPDSVVSRGKRFRMWMNKLAPVDPLL